MLTTDGRTLAIAEKLINEALAEKTTVVQYGHPGAIPDWGTYQRYVGQIMGLMAAKDLLIEARQQAEQEAGTRPEAA